MHMQETFSLSLWWKKIFNEKNRKAYFRLSKHLAIFIPVEILKDDE